jgi:hypothetical protein
LIQLPYVKDVQEDVVRIFEYLIISNRETTHPYFKEIPFLRDEPALANIRKVLQDDTHRLWRDHMEQLLLILQHESLDVRLLALERLQGILVAHKVK